MVVVTRTLLVAGLAVLFSGRFVFAQGDDEIPRGDILPRGVTRRMQQTKEEVERALKSVEQLRQAKSKLTSLVPSAQRTFGSKLSEIDAAVSRFEARERQIDATTDQMWADLAVYNRDPRRNPTQQKALQARAKQIAEQRIANRQQLTQAVAGADRLASEIGGAYEAENFVDGSFDKAVSLVFDDNAPKSSPTVGDVAKQLAEKNKSKYEADANGTKCNILVQDFTRNLIGMDLPEFIDVKANDMIDNMKKSKRFEALDFQKDPQAAFERAQELANKRQLVIVAYRNPDSNKSGHVAVVVPSTELTQSGNWGMRVPYIAQAGETVMSHGKLSDGFSPSRKGDMELYLLRHKKPQ